MSCITCTNKTCNHSSTEAGEGNGNTLVQVYAAHKVILWEAQCAELEVCTMTPSS